MAHFIHQSEFRKKAIVIFLTTLFFYSCSPNSLEDFRQEGESICRELIHDLQKIETREELLTLAPILKNHFEKLVDLMIAEKEYLKDSEEVFEPLEENSVVSDLLLQELKRIYQLESGREVIEKAQKEAFLRLDAFESRH